MELQFRKAAYPCLNPVLQEAQNREQTLEIKLSEGLPDIGQILAAWGQPVLRSKEWRSREVSVSGGMLVWVLYAPEDGTQHRCLEGWVPFQLEWDLPEDVPEGEIRVSLICRFVDARSISARKIMVRVGIGGMVQALCPMEAEVFTPDAVSETAQWLLNTYPLCLPKEAGEKSFVIDEELTLPASLPEPEKLMYYRLQPEITDWKVLGSRLVFHGKGNLHLLYTSEEGSLQSWDFELPFSQFGDLKEDFSSDSQADLVLCPTNVEAELDEEGHLRIKAGMIAQYVVSDQQILTLAEDGYCPGREMTLHRELLQLPAILETRRENILGEQPIPAMTGNVTDMAFFSDFPRQRITEKGICLEQPGSVQVLYLAEDGSLQSAAARWEGRRELPSHGENVIAAFPLTPMAQVLPEGNGVRLEVPMNLTVTGNQGLPMVIGAELGECQQSDSSRPYLILKRAGESGLWEIAKASGSTREAIRKANGLEGEPMPGQMLLIPMGG